MQRADEVVSPAATRGRSGQAETVGVNPRRALRTSAAAEREAYAAFVSAVQDGVK